MNLREKPFMEFRNSKAKIVYDKLKSNNLLKDEEVDSLIHALVDISESIEMVYLELIERLISLDGDCKDSLKDCLWDIREEFRHIEYHINDAKLTEL